VNPVFGWRRPKASIEVRQARLNALIAALREPELRYPVAIGLPGDGETAPQVLRVRSRAELDSAVGDIRLALVAGGIAIVGHDDGSVTLEDRQYLDPLNSVLPWWPRRTRPNWLGLGRGWLKPWSRLAAEERGARRLAEKILGR
jgi:hypothetical protein